MGFRKAKEGDPRVSSEVQIFVENLPTNVTVPELNSFFAKAGKIKKDRETRQPRVWLYHDKTTNEPTGECTITYYNHESQLKALKEFNQAMFQGQTITVTPSIVKFHMARVPPRRTREAARGRGGSVGGHRGRGKPRSDGGNNFVTWRMGDFGTRGQSRERKRSSGLEAPSRVRSRCDNAGTTGRNEERNLSGNGGSQHRNQSAHDERSSRSKSDRRYHPY